jgi:endonuclease/exonuclease/phosphatase family metal-dependent hydrolase
VVHAGPRRDDAPAAHAGPRRDDAPAAHAGPRRDDAVAGSPAPARNSAPARLARRAGAHTFTVASVNLHCGVTSSGEPFDVEGVLCGLDATIIAVQETWQTDAQSGTRHADGVAEGACPVQPARTPVPDPADPVVAAAIALGADLLRLPLCSFPDLAKIGVPPSSGPGHFGIAVLTMLPVIHHEVFSLGPAPGDDIPRYAQIVWLALDDEIALRFVNTHLTYRPASPVQLWRLRQRLRGYRGPTIVVGDLNMPGPIAPLTAGYARAVTGRTWPAERPLLQLDHVLTSSHLETVAATVLPHIGSDHLPVRAQLRLRAARPGVRRAAIAAASRARG